MIGRGLNGRIGSTSDLNLFAITFLLLLAFVFFLPANGCFDGQASNLITGLKDNVDFTVDCASEFTVETGASLTLGTCTNTNNLKSLSTNFENINERVISNFDHLFSHTLLFANSRAHSLCHFFCGSKFSAQCSKLRKKKKYEIPRTLACRRFGKFQYPRIGFLCARRGPAARRHVFYGIADASCRTCT